MEQSAPSLGAFFFLLFVIALFVLDGALLVSLIRPGDERKRMIVWKASTYTLGGIAGYLVLRVVGNSIRGYEALDPFITLSVVATLYFVILLIMKWKHGG